MYNYILNFLQDRTFQVKVGSTKSDSKQLENGVPQGAVISPTLFNIMVNEIGKLEENFKNIGIGQYADDTAIWTKAKLRGCTASGSKTENLKKNK